MLRALLEFGVVPDMVVGSSVGALNGALLATDPETAPDKLTTVWESITRKSIFGVDSKIGAAWSLARDGFAGDGSALCSAEPLARLIRSHVSTERIEQLPIDLVVVTTDLLAGRPKLFRQGSLVRTLVASASIPGVFPPVKIDSMFCVDGGVTANVPVRQALAAGARSLVVLDASPASTPGFVPRNPLEAFVQASMIMVRSQQANAGDELAKKHPIMRLPQPTPPALSVVDFSQSRRLIDAGFTSTKTFLGEFSDLAAKVGNSSAI
jgi:NTE family protein